MARLGKLRSGAGGLLGLLCLLLCAGPAMGQGLDYPANELYTAPWFDDLRHNDTAGGFIARAKRNAADDGWERVEYAYTCYGTTLIQAADVIDERTGLVFKLIDCKEEEKQIDLDLRLRNIQDGGWYWMFKPILRSDGTTTTAAAAAPLVRMDVLAQAPRLEPVTATSSTITADTRVLKVDPDGRGSGGATLVVDSAPGLFEIIPHATAVLPRESCYGVFGLYRGRAADCVVGRSADWQLTLLDNNGAALVAPVVRPASGTASVRARLSITTGYMITGCNNLEIGAALTGGRQGSADVATPGNVTLRTPGAQAGVGCPTPELAFSWDVDVQNDASRCGAANPDRGTAQTVRITLGGRMTGSVEPPLPSLPFVEFQVACPANASAALEGVNLVPENTFEPGA